jgi:RHS repeat-associated protein
VIEGLAALRTQGWGEGGQGVGWPQRQLSELSSSVSKTGYTYDALGRPLTSKQTTDSNEYGFSYTWNSGGQLASMTYPSTRTVTYGFDSGWRVNSVANYVTSISYDPHGAPYQTTLANGVVETALYNTRLQPTSLEATKTASLWKQENFYCAGEAGTCASNNGNVISQKLTAPKTGGGTLVLAAAYGYDGVNRITSAAESGAGTAWSQGFSYGADQYGNLGVTGDGEPPSLRCLSYNPATNRCNSSGFNYDNAGNLTSYAGQTLEYDAENRQTSLANGGTAWNYAYDGEGRRVKKVATTGTTTTATVYVYDAMGRLAAEYSNSTLGNQPDCTTCYLTADHLGSTRLVTDSSGVVKRRIDYHPFGWEVNPGYGNRSTVTGYAATDWSNPKFTGKERDYDTGLNLDYFGARYFAGGMGRFSSPDPYNIITEADGREHFDTYISQPQNWNRYAYVWNNPFRYVDPHGETVYVVAYTSGNPEGGDDEFWKAALTLAMQIMSKKGFNPMKDTVFVQAVSTKTDFKALLKDANNLESKFGKIGSLSLFSHGGPTDGPRFARNSPGATQKDWQFYGGEAELRGLNINWEKGSNAQFFGCNTAVHFTQRFANAQGTPAWGFDTSTSFSGDPNRKSKTYLLQPWNPNIYMTGRDGRSMVRRDPQRPTP